MLEGKFIIIPALGHQNKGKSSFTGSGLFLLMSQCGNNNEFAFQHGGFSTTWSLVAKGLLSRSEHSCKCAINTMVDLIPVDSYRGDPSRFIRTKHSAVPFWSPIRQLLFAKKLNWSQFLVLTFNSTNSWFNAHVVACIRAAFFGFSSAIPVKFALIKVGWTEHRWRGESRTCSRPRSC